MQDLNDVVTRQAREIDALKARLQKTQDKLSMLESLAVGLFESLGMVVSVDESFLQGPSASETLEQPSNAQVTSALLSHFFSALTALD